MLWLGLLMASVSPREAMITPYKYGLPDTYLHASSSPHGKWGQTATDCEGRWRRIGVNERKRSCRAWKKPLSLRFSPAISCPWACIEKSRAGWSALVGKSPVWDVENRAIASTKG